MTPQILEAIDRMAPANGSRAFRATDMGAADGGTSVDMWRRVLKDVRARAPRRPIEMVYTDLPRNDFAQVFRMIHGQTDIKSYYREIEDLYVYASGTSFHDAIFPKESLDLGFSATASHYVSETPGTITGHVHMVGAKGAERQAFIDQGARDWERMLLNRTRELVSGGRLCLLNFGIDGEGRYLGATGGVSMFDTFAELWQGLADDGIITGEEVQRTNFPQVYRTEAEFVAPLQSTKSPVHEAGLRLEHVESRLTRCPYARDFESHGDAARFAREYIPTLRSWSEPTFAAGLSPSRPAEERMGILDEFYGRYERRVAASPKGHGMDYIHIFMIAMKW
ncbi:MAG: SAM-dependent methyltransferase [Hyphomicrobiaceae bacterium]